MRAAKVDFFPERFKPKLLATFLRVLSEWLPSFTPEALFFLDGILYYHMILFFFKNFFRFLFFKNLKIKIFIFKICVGFHFLIFLKYKKK